MKTEVIRLQNLSVKSGAEKVLKNVSFTIYKDEITCLYIPEMKCRNAIIQCLSRKRIPDEGWIWFDERRMFAVSKDSKLVSQMSIGENLFLNSDEIYSFGYLQKRKLYQLADEVLQEAHLGHINPKTPVYLLRDIEKNYIELLKCFSERAGILLIEDITGIYRAYETERLKTLIQFLKSKGIVIIYIIDKATDILDIAERVIFIWNGTVIENADCGKETYPQNKIFGALSGKMTEPQNYMIVDDMLFCVEENGMPLISVGKGEILGVYDEMWKKTPKITRLLSGHSGRDLENLLLFSEGHKICLESYKDALQKGFSIIGEKIQSRQIFYNMNLIDNITIIAEDGIITKGIIQNERMKYYLACEALNKIGYRYLVDEYGAMKKLPKLEGHIEMAIAIARLICTGPRVICFVNPLLSFADTTIYRFQEILKKLKEERITCIIYSRHIKQLENLVDRIAVF